MVRNYKRKSPRKAWMEPNMVAAIRSVQMLGTSVRRAAEEHGLPRKTVAKYVLLSLEPSSQHLGRFEPVFSSQQEQELVDHVLKLERRLYGINCHDMRSLAFQLAEKNGISHPFNSETGLAGTDWLRGFRRRHSESTLRVPEATSAARAHGFNQVAVDKFYDLLDDVTGSGKFAPSRVYNVDETSVLTVQTKNSRVLALRGRRQVGGITSGERGVLSTACLCMSATGQYIPPMLIFPRQRLTDQLKQGAPPETIFSCNASGWMTTSDFNVWFDHFLKHSRPTAADPVLLLLDGHVSHTKNLAFLEKAQMNNVTVISFPPHCSHRLQPLDVSFMAPLKRHFSKAIEKYLRNNPGKVVTVNEISQLLGTAFLQTCSASIAVNGFRKTGIVPFNRHVFEEDSFAPADVTDVDMSIPTLETPGKYKNINDITNVSQSDEEGPFHGFSTESLKKPDIPSRFKEVDKENIVKYQEKQSQFAIGPSMIHPIPKTSTRKIASGKTRKREKAAVLTSSPYRSALRETQAVRDIGELKKADKRMAKPTPKRQRVAKAAKSDVLQDSLCDACGSSFKLSRNGEGWTKCGRCAAWYHNCIHLACPVCI